MGRKPRGQVGPARQLLLFLRDNLHTTVASVREKISNNCPLNQIFMQKLLIFKREQMLLEMTFNCAGPPKPSRGPRPSFSLKALVCAQRGGEGTLADPERESPGATLPGNGKHIQTAGRVPGPAEEAMWPPACQGAPLHPSPPAGHVGPPPLRGENPPKPFQRYESCPSGRWREYTSRLQ